MHGLARLKQIFESIAHYGKYLVIYINVKSLPNNREGFLLYIM